MHFSTLLLVYLFFTRVGTVQRDSFFFFFPFYCPAYHIFKSKNMFYEFCPVYFCLVFEYKSLNILKLIYIYLRTSICRFCSPCFKHKFTKFCIFFFFSKQNQVADDTKWHNPFKLTVFKIFLKRSCFHYIKIYLAFPKKVMKVWNDMKVRKW